MAGTAGLPMLLMMGMMTGSMGMTARHVEGRVAFLKAELKITDAQLPLWNAVADAMRANAESMGSASDGVMGSLRTTPLPEKLESLEKMMTATLGALRRVKAAVDPLYAALSDEQKKTADELLMGSIGVM